MSVVVDALAHLVPDERIVDMSWPPAFTTTCAVPVEVFGDEDRPVRVPGGLASMPPGPGLAAVLAQIPVRRIRGRDTVEVMAAAYRQSCHDRAVFLQALLETGMRQAHSEEKVTRVDHPGEFAAEEARAALVWSRTRSSTTFAFAWDIHERLPMLGEAMYAGNLDEPRAKAFTQWTTGLTDDQAGQIIADLLPQAPGLLVGELIDRIKRMAIAIDPQWAERRYRRALRGRRVEGARNDDGTANLNGLDLPIDRAAAACDRIDTLARACKRAGDKRRISHVRVDLFLGMLDATFTDMDDEQIIAHVLAHPFTDAGDDGPEAPDNDDDGGPEQPDDDGGPEQPDDDGGPEHPDEGGGPEGDDGGGDPGTPDDSAGPEQPGHSAGPEQPGHGGGPGGLGDGARPEEPPDGDPGSSSHGGSGDTDVADQQASDTAGADAEASDAAACARRWSVRELRIEVATLAGLNEDPGEIVGWDFVPATIARSIITTMHDAEWRWLVCDQHGRPLDGGITGKRPSGPSRPNRSRARRARRARRAPGRRRPGIVELQLRIDQLDTLTALAHEHGGAWAAVILDIATQYTTGTGNCDTSGKSARAGDGAGGASEGPGGRGARSSYGRGGADRDMRDTRRRSARAGLRRAVQIRDRSCVHPACRAPASRTDQDHAKDHAHGGLTVGENLGSFCRHDHRVKHDGGWHVFKPAPDTTVWLSPLGHTYTHTIPPVMPPLPRPRPPADTAADAAFQAAEPTRSTVAALLAKIRTAAKSAGVEGAGVESAGIEGAGIEGGDADTSTPTEPNGKHEPTQPTGCRCHGHCCCREAPILWPEAKRSERSGQPAQNQPDFDPYLTDPPPF